MDKFIAWGKKHLPTKRRLIQLYAALLYNAHLKGFITGNIYTGKGKIFCVPGLNCYSCPGAVGSCPLGALQNAIGASGNRAPAYVLGILLLFGLTLGRTICGFLCPFGMLQELLHKIPTPKVPKSRFTRGLSWLKYAILAIFVLIIPLWYAFQGEVIPAFCKYICPAGTAEGAIGLLSHPVNADKFSMLGILFTRKFVIMALIIAACVFVYRAFCRFLCPLGAIYGLFSKVAVIGVKVEPSRCTDCGKCVRQCGMDIRHVGDHECIHCGECIDGCPTGAISLKAGKILLRRKPVKTDTKSNGKKSLLIWICAILVLAGVLIACNLPETAERSVQEESDPQISAGESLADESIPVGMEVGMRAPDFEAPLYGENAGTFKLSEHRGKTVIVNFWATWCTPCCKELVHFDALFQNHRDSATVVAVHSNLITDDVQGYLSEYDYSFPFAQDEMGDIIKSFGGSTMLPHTVVIDAEGVITYNAVGSLTYAELEALLAEAQKEQ